MTKLILLCSLVAVIYCQIQCSLPYTQCGANLCYNPQIQNCVDGTVQSIGANGTVNPPSGENCRLTSIDATNILSVWIQSFPFSAIIPVIGFPENANGAVTITHDLRMASNEPAMPLNINGLDSFSPLSTNALYSTECRNGKFINLYEAMIPDIPGTNGEPSTAQIYVNALRDLGMDVAGFHFHWTGATHLPEDKGVFAIHHQTTGDMSPIDFSNRTIAALKTTLLELAARTGQ